MTDGAFSNPGRAPGWLVLDRRLPMFGPRLGAASRKVSSETNGAQITCASWRQRRADVYRTPLNKTQRVISDRDHALCFLIASLGKGL